MKILLTIALFLALPGVSMAPFMPPARIAYFRAPVVTRISPHLVITICRWETRGMPDRWNAIGRAGEIGACQIKPDTAREATKFKGTNPELIADIFKRSSWYAEKVLEKCLDWGWKNDSYDMPYCYNGGFRATRGRRSIHKYARQVSGDYATRTLARLWWKTKA